MTVKKSVNLQYGRKVCFLKINCACSLLKLILQNGSDLFSPLQRLFFSNLVPLKHDITSVLTLQKLTVDRY